MTLRARIGGVLLGLSVVGAMGILPSLAQEPAASSKQEKGGSGKGYRRTPPYFSKVGMTTEQNGAGYQDQGRCNE